MTNRSKFEQMLEHLLSEDQHAHESARELFHQLVVEKSREIYQNILSEDFDMYEEDDEEGETVGGDEGDDFIDDTEFDEEGDEGEFDEEDEDLEDRVMSVEDELEQLKAEFEQLMADEEGEDHDMSDDEYDAEDDSEEDDESETKEGYVREYVERVPAPKHGDNGVNTKSVVARKNNMGGTAKNIVSGGNSEKGGTVGGLANPSASEEDFDNINVPGGKAGKTAFRKKESAPKVAKDSSKSIIGSKGRK